jgi:hypothetical protein
VTRPVEGTSTGEYAGILTDTAAGMSRTHAIRQFSGRSHVRTLPPLRTRFSAEDPP